MANSCHLNPNFHEKIKALKFAPVGSVVKSIYAKVYLKLGIDATIVAAEKVRQLAENRELTRCWNVDDPLYIKYHDEEWGVPSTDDNKLFEFLVLDAFQAGLSWLIILRKRDAFRGAFDGFEPQKIAKYTATTWSVW